MIGLRTVQGYGSKVDTMVEELILCLEAPWLVDEILTYCCKRLSISMGNAIRFLKAQIAKLTISLQEAKAKASLVVEINYIKVVCFTILVLFHPYLP
jgi:hypothetical protein